MTRYSFSCDDCATTKYYDTEELATEAMTNHANILRHAHFTIEKNGRIIESVEFVEE